MSYITILDRAVGGGDRVFFSVEKNRVVSDAKSGEEISQFRFFNLHFQARVFERASIVR